MQFKSEVTIGTIISTIMMISAGMAAWAHNKERIQHVETEVITLHKVDDDIKKQMIQNKDDIIKRLDEIKADVREIRNSQRK